MLWNDSSFRRMRIALIFIFVIIPNSDIRFRLKERTLRINVYYELLIGKKDLQSRDFQ